MADHLRTGPVPDALETTLWHRRVEPGAVHRRRFDGPELPTLECEPLDRRATFRNRTDAKLGVFDSIEGSSNLTRLHSTRLHSTRRFKDLRCCGGSWEVQRWR